MNAYGLYAELANAPAYAVTHHPASLSWVEAAALDAVFHCLRALIDIAGLKSGETVVIPAASSSVGLAAISDREQSRGRSYRFNAWPYETAGHHRCGGGTRDCHG